MPRAVHISIQVIGKNTFGEKASTTDVTDFILSGHQWVEKGSGTTSRHG